MSYGETKIVKDDTQQVIAAVTSRVKDLYEQARERGQQSLDSLTPVDKGNLKASSRAEVLHHSNLQPRSSGGQFASGSPGIGFEMRSFGDEGAGKAYAAPVNNGHHTASGGFVPANPYFSQSVADAKAVIEEGIGNIIKK